MTVSRIISLAPSATATLAAAGLAERVVGVTAHCELDRPTVGGWLNPDYERLAELSPELVCTSDRLQGEIHEELKARGYNTFHHEPSRLTDVLEGFESLPKAAGAAAAGRELRESAERRLTAVDERVEARLAEGASRPTVYCEEWSDPPMAAGNWVPDAVEAAGGRYPFVTPGERSQEVDREIIEGVDPDHAVLHICGTGSQVRADRIHNREWAVDPAVHVFDDSLLNQPSPHLIRGIEQLSRRLYPE